MQAALLDSRTTKGRCVFGREVFIFIASLSSNHCSEAFTAAVTRTREPKFPTGLPSCQLGTWRICKLSHPTCSRNEGYQLKRREDRDNCFAETAWERLYAQIKSFINSMKRIQHTFLEDASRMSMKVNKLSLFQASLWLHYSLGGVLVPVLFEMHADQLSCVSSPKGLQRLLTRVFLVFHNPTKAFLWQRRANRLRSQATSSWMSPKTHWWNTPRTQILYCVVSMKTLSWPFPEA